MRIAKMKAKFNIEKEWNRYLKNIGLTEKEMHPIQATETKRAFMGGLGQMLFLMTEEISELEEGDGVRVVQSLLDQVLEYWKKEAGE